MCGRSTKKQVIATSSSLLSLYFISFKLLKNIYIYIYQTVLLPSVIHPAGLCAVNCNSIIKTNCPNSSSADTLEILWGPLHSATRVFVRVKAIKVHPNPAGLRSAATQQAHVGKLQRFIRINRLIGMSPHEMHVHTHTHTSTMQSWATLRLFHHHSIQKIDKTWATIRGSNKFACSPWVRLGSRQVLWPPFTLQNKHWRHRVHGQLVCDSFYAINQLTCPGCRVGSAPPIPFSHRRNRWASRDFLHLSESFSTLKSSARTFNVDHGQVNHMRRR